MLWWNVLQLKIGSRSSRVRALLNLGESQDPRALDPVAAVAVEAVRDGASLLQQAAAEALGALGDPNAIPILNLLLEKGNEDVQMSAVEALWRIADPRVVPPLVSALKDMRGVRKAAVTALVQLGEMAVPALLPVLKDKNKEACKAAGEALAGIGAAAVPALVVALQEAETREFAIGLLVQIGVPALVPLQQAAKHGDETTRRHAVATLGKMKNAAALEMLVSLLEDPAGSVRREAILALEALDWQPHDAADRARRAVARGEWEEVTALGDVAVAPLLAELDDPDLGVRDAATRALIQIGKEAVEPLLTLLKDPERLKRFHAAQALAEIGDPRALEPLLVALDDSDASVRDNAVLALWKFGGARAVDGLVRALKDEDRIIRARAARALGEVGGEQAIEPLVEASRNDELVRSAAAIALWQIAPARAIAPLTTLATDDATAEEALLALSQVLEQSAADIAPEDLQKLAQLRDHFQKPSLLDEPDAGKRSGYVKRKVDPSRVCDLARKELARRGLAT